MKNVVYLLLFVLLTNCSSTKRSQKFLYEGDYDKAIQISIKKLQKSSTQKKDKEHILLLEEAFKKATAKDVSRVSLLEKEGNPENTREILEIYQAMEYRQRRIQSLLPLSNASFKIANYTDQIATAKDNYANFLFARGSQFLSNNTIPDARTAHGYFSKLKRLNAAHPQVDSLLEEAHYTGTDFVHVIVRNRTEQVIPKRLEAAILDFDTYRLDNFWTEYHANRENNIDYNYGIVLDIREILISPERISEKEFERKKEVSDGWEYVLDANGNVKKDSLGNDIKIDVFKELKANVIVSNQFKSVLVGGNVVYRDLKQNKNRSQFPIRSEFVFEHIFAVYRGDEEALTKRDKELLRRQYAEFPSNEQMIFDTSTDLKNKFARILKRKPFR